MTPIQIIEMFHNEIRLLRFKEQWASGDVALAIVQAEILAKQEQIYILVAEVVATQSEILTAKLLRTPAVTLPAKLAEAYLNAQSDYADAQDRLQEATMHLHNVGSEYHRKDSK